MELGSKQDGGVVNMTRAMEALSPWLNHPRRTIFKVEVLVLLAAVLLVLQFVLGCCKRRWHNSLVKNLLQMLSKLISPLAIYTLGTMQSSPVKNSSYPVWAAFLIMASVGTTVVREYDFCASFNSKYMEGVVEVIKYTFYYAMFQSLLDPNNRNWKNFFIPNLHAHAKNPRKSSIFVIFLFYFIMMIKIFESTSLALGYNNQKGSLYYITKKKIRPTQVAVMRTEESANDQASDSDHPSMKGYKYKVCPRHLWGFEPWITIEQIWDYCDNTAYGKELKDLCLSCALFRQLMQKFYFRTVYPKTSLLEDHDFVFKKLLPSEGDFKRAFTIIEVELGFCYDFFFTKYFGNFISMNLPLPFIQSMILLKTILILFVGVLAIKKSLVLETPNPIIEVHNSEADYMITILLLVIALIVELLQAVSFLSSNWAQVSLASMYVKKHWHEPNAFIFGKVIAFLRRRVPFFGQQLMIRNKINQHSVIFRQKQLDPVKVSDAVKRAVARSLISTYGNNLTIIGETSLWQDQMFDECSWALKGLTQLEVMLIWHIATEYCDISSPTPSNNRTTRYRCSEHRGFADHLFGYVLQLLPNHRRNRAIHRDIHRVVAIHLSRYCAYLIGSVPELLPYHESDIAGLAEKVMEERTELFGSYRFSMIYSKMKNLEGTEEEDEPQKIFEKGIKLGKQLERMADGDRWEVLEDFWSKTIIHAAKSHYTTKQHMQHLEDGGEFLTHIWALLAHAGILNLNMGKDQKGQDKAAV